MSNNPMSIKARTIAIVGAGPSGVIAAKYLRAEKAFERIVLFEQRSKAGGIWTYTGDQTDEDLFAIPQLNPRQGPQKPRWKPRTPSETASHITNGINGVDNANTVGEEKESSFLSPLYEALETNIPRGLMGFQDLDWPTDSQLFPRHGTVLKYIEDYGHDVQDLVQYETQVLDIVPTDSSSTDSWSVTSQNIRTLEKTTEEFDAVTVANGHFIVPYVPDIPGIKDWNDAHPGVVSHAKYYRRASDFAGKKVIVVGNSASGADISKQIVEHSQRPLLWSSKSTSLFSATHGMNDPRRKEVPQITRFLPELRGVQFADGMIEHDIDAIVFATGYLYSLPFLEKLEPKLITDGAHVHHTYQHVFYAPRPTLSFLALNQRVIPFPLAEAQAAVIARVYSGRLTLPSLAAMEEWQQSTVAEMGDGRSFHLLNFPKDGMYINHMSTWALRASRRTGYEDDWEGGPLENKGQGKIPPIWGEWEFWCRENFPAIRRAFGQLGEQRHQAKNIEEVGFIFDEYLEVKKRQSAMKE